MLIRGVIFFLSQNADPNMHEKISSRTKSKKKNLLFIFFNVCKQKKLSEYSKVLAHQQAIFVFFFARAV